jgi:SAM-dependent methyltransferase
MSRETRWESEQQFFDSEEYSEQPVAESTIRRYTECRKPWLAAEFPFYILGDVAGKYILELGCGDGGNAILLALRGAEVVGIDISPRAIEIARHRAALHGVSARTTFIAKPMELFQTPGCRKFDIVCGWAVLHHLIPVLEATMAQLRETAAPGALFLFLEPISLWHWLRRLRLLLPIPTLGTPDERPLERAEMPILRKVIPEMQIHYFNALIRAADRFLLGACYEDFSPAARMFYDVLARIDDFCLNRLGLTGLASSAALYGRTWGR